MNLATSITLSALLQGSLLAAALHAAPRAENASLAGSNLVAARSIRLAHTPPAPAPIVPIAPAPRDPIAPAPHQEPTPDDAPAPRPSAPARRKRPRRAPPQKIAAPTIEPDAVATTKAGAPTTEPDTAAAPAPADTAAAPSATDVGIRRAPPTASPTSTRRPASAPAGGALARGPERRGAIVAYKALIFRELSRRIEPPRAIRRAGLRGTAYVMIRFDASGRILSVALRRSSGHPRIDRAAIAAVRALGSIPAPPAALGVKRSSLTVPIRFGR